MPLWWCLRSCTCAARDRSSPLQRSNDECRRDASVHLGWRRCCRREASVPRARSTAQSNCCNLARVKLLCELQTKFRNKRYSVVTSKSPVNQDASSRLYFTVSGSLRLQKSYYSAQADRCACATRSAWDGSEDESMHVNAGAV